MQLTYIVYMGSVIIRGKVGGWKESGGLVNNVDFKRLISISWAEHEYMDIATPPK